MEYRIVEEENGIRKRSSPSKLIFSLAGIGILMGIGYYRSTHEIKLVPLSPQHQEAGMMPSSAYPRTDHYGGHIITHNHPGPCKLNHQTLDDILKK